MAKDKNTVVVYTDWIHTFEAMTDDEAGRLIKHFFRYVNDQQPVAPDKLIAVSFALIEQTLKRDLKSWEAKVDKKRNSGHNGGVKSGETRRKNKEKKQNKANALISKQTQAKEPVTVSVTVTGNVNDNQ